MIFDRIASSQETQTRGIDSTEAMDGHGAYTAVDPFVREMWLERKAVLTDGPSTVLPIRDSLGEADPRAGDPAHKNCRVRRVTMRHWITSFTC